MTLAFEDRSSDSPFVDVPRNDRLFDFQALARLTAREFVGIVYEHGRNLPTGLRAKRPR